MLCNPSKQIAETLPRYRQPRSLWDKAKLLAAYSVGAVLRMAGLSSPFILTPKDAVGSWIKWFERHELPAVRSSVAILALRNQSWMDWALYAACWARRLGIAPVILYSKADAEAVYGSVQSHTVRQRILTLGLWNYANSIPDVSVIELDNWSDQSATISEHCDDNIQRISHSNAAYELCVEENEEGEWRGEYERAYQAVRRELARETDKAYAVLKKVKDKYGVNRLVGFSGIIGKSAGYEIAASHIGMHRVWVEGWDIRPGLMRFNENRPALDIDGASMVRKMSWTEDDRENALSYLRFQERGQSDTDSDRKSEEVLKYQIVTVDEGIPSNIEKFISADDRPVFLMTPNVVGDSATLQRQTIFTSQREWICRTIEYFISHPEYRLVVRAHPSERMRSLNGKLRVCLGDVASEAAGNAENIYVINCMDPVNTYSLLPHATVGLAWVSNTAVDMVVRGVPVISAARGAYSGLGVSVEPKSVEDYFKLIESYGHNPIMPTEEQIENGLKYLYLIYNKIGMRGYGERRHAAGLSLDHAMDSEYAKLYSLIFGVKDS